MRALKLSSPVSCIAILFAITLQIQITLFASGNYMGLRISAADFLIPFAGIGILISLFLKRSILPKWKKPFTWHLPVLMTCVMTMAMINGYFIQGGLNQWALVNKFAGWFILMAYFGAGAWLAANYKESAPSFLKYFCGFFILTAALEIGDQFLRARGIMFGPRSDMELVRGFMGNRNAFAFLMCCVAGFITLYGFHKKFISTHMLILFWVIFPLIFLFNGSRTLWICTAILFASFLIIDWKKSLRFMLPSILIGVIAFFTVFSSKQREFFSLVPYNSMSRLYTYAQKPEDPHAAKWAEITGDLGRMEIIKGAVTLIGQYPVQGAGLGSVTFFQEQNNARTRNIIDNTGLWLLTETGAIGLGIFTTSYVLMALALWRGAGDIRDPEYILPLAALVMMLCFGIFSLLHEILYTRFFWFILGLALAVPKTHPEPQEI